MARVQEMLADPDPLQRLANMEAIVASGDALKLQTALRTAFSGDDLDLRALALRAYLASRKSITFEVIVPAAVLSAYNDAKLDRAAERSFNQRYPYYVRLSRWASRFQLEFPDYTFTQERGSAYSERRAGSFTINGDRFMATVQLHTWGQCYVDMSPTRKQSFEGTLACASWPSLAITAAAP